MGTGDADVQVGRLATLLYSTDTTIDVVLRQYYYYYYYCVFVCVCMCLCVCVCVIIANITKTVDAPEC